MAAKHRPDNTAGQRIGTTMMRLLFAQTAMGWCSAASSSTGSFADGLAPVSLAFAHVARPSSFRSSSTMGSSYTNACSASRSPTRRKRAYDSGSLGSLSELTESHRVGVGSTTMASFGSGEGGGRDGRSGRRNNGGRRGVLVRAAGALIRRAGRHGASASGNLKLNLNGRFSRLGASETTPVLVSAASAAPNQRASTSQQSSIRGSQGGGVETTMAMKADWRRGSDWRTSPPAATRESVSSFSSAARAAGEAAKVEEKEIVDKEGALYLKAGTKPEFKLRFGTDLKNDFMRRAKLYKSDWTDGFNRKSLPAIMFLYFACLLPAVAFGGIASQVTQGTLGVIEYVVSCGLGGMAYATFSGQPMTFIGPTGLTLAFMTALYSFTSVAGLPFLPVYSWVGMWTSGMLVTLAVMGASNMIEYATQFTDDVFNALLSVNFIFEACRSLQRNFNPTAAGYSQAGALMSLNVALATYAGCRKTSDARDSRLLNSGVREFIADFGPIMIIVGMSFFCAMPTWKGLLSFLHVPAEFMLCKGRSWLVPMLSVAPKIRMACALPALLLTSLFFLDQNISSRVVNSPRHKMKKGPAYHQDMFVLGLITGLLSFVGLPWQCAATVQSLNHVRQMATLGSSAPSTSGTGKRSEEIASIYETRVTGFCVHALVLGSLALLPQLGKIPMAVVSGIFLYLGRKVMSGNGFLIRVKEILVDKSLLSPESDIKQVGFKTSLRYTLVQAGMLGLLWTLKSFERTALFFPSVIGLLIIVRIAALPKMFSASDLDKLDAAVG